MAEGPRRDTKRKCGAQTDAISFVLSGPVRVRGGATTHLGRAGKSTLHADRPGSSLFPGNRLRISICHIGDGRHHASDSALSEQRTHRQGRQVVTLGGEAAAQADAGREVAEDEEDVCEC